MHGENVFPNSCCFGFKDCGAGSPGGCRTSNKGFPFVTTCLLGLRAGRWMVLSMMLLWGATPPPRGVFKCRLAEKFPIAGLWLLLSEDTQGVPAWTLIGGICCPLIIPVPWEIPVVRWLILHDLPFIFKELMKSKRGFTDPQLWLISIQSQ